MSISIKLLRTLFFLAAIVIFSVAFALCAWAASEGGVVNATNLNFRSEPSTSAESYGFANIGDTVIITGEEGDWYSVIYNGQPGYMFAAYVTPTSAVNVNGFTAYVSGNTVRLRDGAGYEADTLAYLNAGKQVTVIGINDCWYKVTVDSSTGYIHSDYVTVRSVASASAEAEKIIEFAMQYLGTGYVYGGASPSGFDCSGFVSYVLNSNGYEATRTCGTMYAQYTHISKEDLVPGDLVVFASYSGWDTNHIGIYIGNNEFIHSSSGAGYVTINNLDDSYYYSMYYGACRFLW